MQQQGRGAGATATRVRLRGSTRVVAAAMGAFFDALLKQTKTQKGRRARTDWSGLVGSAIGATAALFVGSVALGALQMPVLEMAWPGGGAVAIQPINVQTTGVESLADNRSHERPGARPSAWDGLPNRSGLQKTTAYLKTDLFRPPPRVLGPHRAVASARPVRFAKANLNMYAYMIAAAHTTKTRGHADDSLVTGSVAAQTNGGKSSGKSDGVPLVQAAADAMTHLSAPGGQVTAEQVPAWRRFASPFAKPANLTGPQAKPTIAIVLDDLGPDVLATRRAINLPPQVTLSFLPYARNAAMLGDEARALGHEILVHLPMEPHGSANPGPHALKLSQANSQFLTELNWNLDRFEGYVGVNNHMGSRLTENGAPMLTVMQELRRRRLMFLDSRTTTRSLAATMAAGANVPVLERDVFIDHAAGPDHVLAQLFELERVAGQQGYAIAIGHPHPLTLDMLEIWVRSLEVKGLSLVPLTSLLAAKASKKDSQPEEARQASIADEWVH